MYTTDLTVVDTNYRFQYQFDDGEAALLGIWELTDAPIHERHVDTGEEFDRLADVFYSEFSQDELLRQAALQLIENADPHQFREQRRALIKARDASGENRELKGLINFTDAIADLIGDGLGHSSVFLTEENEA